MIVSQVEPSSNVWSQQSRKTPVLTRKIEQRPLSHDILETSLQDWLDGLIAKKGIDVGAHRFFNKLVLSMKSLTKSAART